MAQEAEGLMMNEKDARADAEGAMTVTGFTAEIVSATDAERATEDTPAGETSTDRLELIVGTSGLQRLKDSCVLVAGLGGVGSSCAEALVRGGVGTLVLIDKDIVEPSNLNRQALAFTSTIGRPKADVMREMALDINPNVHIVAAQMYLPAQGMGEVLEEFLVDVPHLDYVVDAIDTVSQKLALAEWCQAQGTPEISAMGAANKLDPCRLRFARIEDTSICPLARIMRKGCRARGIHDLEVIYSDEQPLEMPPVSDEEWAKNGAPLGTMSYLPPIMGQMIASRVIRDLLGWQ